MFYSNKVNKAHRKLITRWADQKYYFINFIYEKFHCVNPKFTEDDRKKKCEIFNIPNDKICFITGKPCKGTGDHLFEINGYAKKTNGLHGTNDEWNKIPVIGSKNKSYKTKFGKNNKNIGYQDLTDEELKKCTNDQKNIYQKIKSWKEYVKKRGASLTWKLTEKQERAMANKKEEYEKMWNMDNINNLLD